MWIIRVKENNYTLWNWEENKINRCINLAWKALKVYKNKVALLKEHFYVWLNFVNEIF